MRDDVSKVLKDFKISTFGFKKDIERVEAFLDANEPVLFITPTNLTSQTVGTAKQETLPGIFVLTDKRIVFSYKVLWDVKTEVVPISEIRTWNLQGSAITVGHLEINTIPKVYNFIVSNKKENMEALQKILENVLSNVNKPSSVSSSPDNNVLEQIEKLSELKDKGILTEEEFQSKKSDLLAKL